jgi:hypothetical protein
MRKHLATKCLAVLAVTAACGPDFETLTGPCRKIQVGDDFQGYQAAVIIDEYHHLFGPQRSPLFSEGSAMVDFCCASAADWVNGAPGCPATLTCADVPADTTVWKLKRPYTFTLDDPSDDDDDIWACSIGVRDGKVSSVWMTRFWD